MRRFEVVGLTAAAVLSATGAHADQPADAAPKPAGQAGDQGVTAYPAAFFNDARPGNAMDMISRLPGFTFDGGAQVRGFAGAAGNVLIDGERPTTKQDDLQQILRRIPAELVDHIEVIRGGAPGIDMQGRTIIANVVRKKGRSTTGLIGVADQNSFYDGRNTPTVRVEGAIRNDGRSLEGSFVSGGFMDNGVGPGPHTQTDNTGATVYNARVAAEAGGWQSSATAAYEQPFLGGKLRINGLLFDQYYNDQEDDRATLPAVGGNDDFHDRPTQDKGELGVHFTRDFGAKLTLETLALQQVQRRTDSSIYNAPGDFETFYEADDLAESILRATVRYRFSPQLTLQGSAEGAYNIQRTWTGYYVNQVNQDLPAFVTENEARGEIAFLATWTPSPKYTLEAGMRTEDSTIRATGDLAPEGKTLVYPKPRVVFTWSPDPLDQMRLRVEREVGQLDFGAFTASSALNAGGVHLGNPGLLPQDAWVGEAALERRFWGKGDVTVTLRRQEINDAVDRGVGQVVNPGPPPSVTYFDEPGNIGHARENDLVVDVTVPLDKINIPGGLLKATGTWRSTEATDPTTGVMRPLSQVHGVDSELHFSQDLNNIKSTWGVDAYGPWTEQYWRFDEIDVFHWGGQATLFFEYKPNPKLSWRAEFQQDIGGGFSRNIAYYNGPRNLYPAPYLADFRREQPGPTLYIRVRKGFG